MLCRIKKEIVARALQRLRAQKTHTLFSGYLHLQQMVGYTGRITDLKPQFLEFFNTFFLVPGHPLGTPYIKPFEQSPSKKNLWLNKNVAGTYAPSSLRPGKPFRRVVDIVDGKYFLYESHASLARNNLLSEPVHAADLAVFLYRNFGFRPAPVTIYDLINIFAYEFGYADNEGDKPNKDFDVLYSLETAKNWDEDWLLINE